MTEVLLRDVVEADLPALFECQDDREAAEHAAIKRRDRDAFMTHWANILRDATGIRKSILYCGEVVGFIVGYQSDERRVIGYQIARRYWGRGIATKALSEFLRFETTRPLYAYVAKRNIGSVRVLEMCRFTVASESVVTDDHGAELEEFMFELKA